MGQTLYLENEARKEMEYEVRVVLEANPGTSILENFGIYSVVDLKGISFQKLMEVHKFLEECPMLVQHALNMEDGFL